MINMFCSGDGDAGGGITFLESTTQVGRAEGCGENPPRACGKVQEPPTPKLT